ncbi:hypothetical protein EDF48_102148 [Curtobacterium sp. PhB191]|uniref:hypothetical protein n=1 Tax=Curtobacterium sp. PhB191 TaxID=2485202 RepID=UPI0010463213|nr:hypothetical protein [Curtobacterium sp. PhB191]TCU86487.1 hypothetical protein EDF48_102148 [Curtobacterium sp. PhB191]
MNEQPPVEQLAYSIPSFAKAVDLSETTIREAIKRSELVPSYPAKMKPIITREEGHRWLRSLPDEPPQAH